MKKLDFENSLGLAIKNASKSLERALDIELRGQYGLSGGQWKVILVLSIQNGLSQKDLAERIFVDSTTLVPIIDGMEKKGLVERKTDPKDRRNNNVFLTAKSEPFVDPIIEIILRMRKIFFKNISEDDLEFTRNTLKKITTNADSYITKSEGKIQQPLK
ncbi:MAG: MarR family transcriptional regulator [Thaumarchaeota archaeon]|nr:MarR family transcriptional regulator [Nitrososphaerota archaeon]MBI3641632.1 MarR family transcriptional regulator [Nitrososphaerota archaeon]